MPINTPDGTQVSEIILPDGSSATRVFDPNGNRVFEAAIPDSGLPQTEHRWVLDEGSGTTWRDAVGSADATANFENWVSGDWIGGYKSNLDGTDDKADTPITPPSGSMWLSATVDFDSTKSYFEVLQGTNPAGGINAGERIIQFTDSGDVEFLTAPVDGVRYRPSTNITTGRHRVVGYVDMSNNEVGIAVDGTIQDTVATSGEAFDQLVDNIHGIGYSRDGDLNYYNGGLDDVGVGSNAPSSTDIQNDYDSQPWS